MTAGRRVCVFGAGAVGSHVAAKLLRAGTADLSVVARGAHLAAMRERGLTFRSDGENFHLAVPKATDDPSGLPPQDVLLVTLKAPALPAAATALSRLLAPDGVAVFLVNGIPWWWKHGLATPGPAGNGGLLPLLDPEGTLWNGLGPQRALGSVVYSGNELAEPGVVAHYANNRFIFGEPDGSLSARARAVAELFTNAGMPSELSADIRAEVWHKLLLNASNNPLAALSRLSAHDRALDPELAGLGDRVLEEVIGTAGALGWDLRKAAAESPMLRDSARSTSRPSMLQDALLGRPMEVEGLLGQVQAFARSASVHTPVIDVILPILRGLARSSYR